MKSVTICGSARFESGMRKFAKELKDFGVVVFEPHLYSAAGGNWEKVTDFDKKFVALGLTLDHFYKIRLGDVIFVYNEGGYSGNSTTLEIGFAAALDKPIYALAEDKDEIFRGVLFREVIDSPKEFAKRLQ